jgi:hypothetical protein
MAYKQEVFFSVRVAQVAYGFVVPKWIEDLEFH